jgi:hypothetical protein
MDGHLGKSSEAFQWPAHPKPNPLFRLYSIFSHAYLESTGVCLSFPLFFLPFIAYPMVVNSSMIKQVIIKNSVLGPVVQLRTPCKWSLIADFKPQNDEKIFQAFRSAALIIYRTLILISLRNLTLSSSDFFSRFL